MKLNEIMPYYNKRYNSELLTFNPFENINITVNGNNSGSNTQSTSSTGSGNSTGGDSSAYSDTPQNGLSEVDNLEYLTNYTKNTNTNTSQSSATGQGTSQSQGSYAETKTGKDGTDSFMTLLNQYCDTFLNVDMEIIESLNSLFMNIY